MKAIMRNFIGHLSKIRLLFSGSYLAPKSEDYLAIEKEVYNLWNNNAEDKAMLRRDMVNISNDFKKAVSKKSLA